MVNAVHMLISSNNDWVVPAGSNSRRYFVTEVSDHRMQDQEYFEALAQELASGGEAAMLHDLLNRDLQGWHPRMTFVTSALQQQRELSLPPHERAILDLLLEGQKPMKDGFYRNASDDCWCDSETLIAHFSKRFPGMWDRSMKLFAPILRELGFVNKQHSETRRMSWYFPPLKEARAAWNKRFGEKTWPEPLDWV